MATIPRPLPHEKHANAVDFYDFDFSTWLAATEALSGTPTVTVSQGSGSTWTDYTTQFVTGAASIQGTSVRQKLKAAATGEQVAGTYAITCTVSTDQQRTFVMAGDLIVSEKGRI